ncbi:Wadjet anti-phage system protein JetD domain-containing protein [Xanthomonas translucens pv. undulosa]|uniref:Wadjet anti-phage system protein JetD domain-containing protein n=1 Tax=Xanthomonas campestris pv. translucens TaxID=343 RepID=UPI003CEA9628
MSEVTEALLAWLRRQSGAGSRLQAKSIVQRAAQALDTDLVSIYGAFRELRAEERVSYAPDTMGVPYRGYLIVTAEPIPASATATAWNDVLVLEGVDPKLALALAQCHGIFDGLDETDMRLAVRGLLRVREASRASTEDFGFSVSAREILGSSKVLGRLPATTIKLLGIDQLVSTPRYLVVAGPASPAGVLLIENTTSFEMAVRAGLDAELALVAAYGYGLNMMSDSSAGLALLNSISNRRCEILSRSGQGHSLPHLLAHPRLYFWGDLDREGLRIALALRKILPMLSLSALYAPMRVLAAERATSHPYVGMSGKALQAPWVQTGDKLIDQLAACCEYRAVDQEALDIAKYRCLAMRKFDEADFDVVLSQANG